MRKATVGIRKGPFRGKVFSIVLPTLGEYTYDILRAFAQYVLDQRVRNAFRIALESAEKAEAEVVSAAREKASKVQVITGDFMQRVAEQQERERAEALLAQVRSLVDIGSEEAMEALRELVLGNVVKVESTDVAA